MALTREELVTQANELGLEFAPNVGDKKLQSLIDEALGTTPEPEVKAPEVKAAPAPDLGISSKRKRIAELKKKAFETKLVTITNKDIREADVVTTAHLSFENSYFGLAKNVPLDVQVELENALIEIAKKAQMTIHKDEIVDGKRTGNKTPVRVAKYAVDVEERIK